jgi:hypothetical protein
MKYAGLLAAAAAVLALSALEDAVAAPPPQSLPNGLQLVPGTKVALAYERPGTQWTKYRTILLKPLNVPANARNAAPPGTVPGFGESYIIPDDGVAELQKDFADSMHNILGQAGFTFVTTPGANTLLVAPKIMRIQLSAPIQSSRESFAGGGFTVSEGGGSMTIEAVLADATSKVVLAEVEDRRYGSNLWGLNNSVSNFAQAREAFDQWARDLTNRLQTP